MLPILHLTCVFGICVLDIFSGFSGWWVELFTVAFRRVQRVYVDQAITTGATATNFFRSSILIPQLFSSLNDSHILPCGFYAESFNKLSTIESSSSILHALPSSNDADVVTIKWVIVHSAIDRSNVRSDLRIWKVMRE